MDGRCRDVGLKSTDDDVMVRWPPVVVVGEWDG